MTAVPPGNRNKGAQALPHISAPLPRNQICVLVILILFSILSYYLISRFLVTAVVVQGRSMTPTLQDGDRYVLNRWAFHSQSPQRGDLVVLKDPGHDDYAVKRIVGTPCETVHLKNESVYVNGTKLNEPYLSPGTETRVPNLKETIVVVGKDHFFVMGDNRPNSEDSRFYGAVHRSQIVGLISR